MKRKLIPLLGIAFVVAVISTGIFYGLIAGKLRGGSEAPAGLQIVVAAHNLDRGTILDKSQLKVAPLNGGPIPKGAFMDPDQAAGLTVLHAIEEGHPVTQPSLSPREGAASAQAIPAGMRAVSVHVSDSPGVVALLRPGHRVDVQAVRNRAGQASPEVELRTILQDVEVLAVQNDTQQNRGNNAPVVTLLAKPSEGDMLGVADAGAHIRLALRNPTDKEKAALATMALAALFQPGAASRAPALLRAASTAGTRPVVRKADSTPPDAQVYLRVRIAGATAAALDEISARMIQPKRSDGFQVAALRSGWDVEKLLDALQTKRQLEILSASSLLTANHREASMQAGAHWNAPSESASAAGVSIQFLPSIERGGMLRLQVKPEITCTQGSSVATRKIEAEVELAEGQSVLVTGLAASAAGVSLVARLFPGRPDPASNPELFVLVTPQLVPAPAGRQAAALLKRP